MSIAAYQYHVLDEWVRGDAQATATYLVNRLADYALTGWRVMAYTVLETNAGAIRIHALLERPNPHARAKQYDTASALRFEQDVRR